MVGDASKAIINQKMNSVIDISYEHADNFTKNMATVRCEERFALEKYRNEGFIFGTLAESLT